MVKKYAIVVGHTKMKQGACSPYDLPCEWQFNKKIAENMRDIADIYYHDHYNFGYKSMIKRTAKRIDKNDYDLVIELHYNKAESSAANGVEALHYFKNNDTRYLSVWFANRYSHAFGVVNRGIKGLANKYDRGYWMVAIPRAPVMILEPFFGSNKNDVAKYKKNPDLYMQIIRELFAESSKIK